MKRIGLTGNLGCGKSTVASMFRNLGALVVDADDIIRSFYKKESPIFKSLIKLLGNEVIGEEGNIDRKKVADKVFTNEIMLRELERLTHEEFYRKLEAIESKNRNEDILIVEASLIFEKGSEKRYDKIIVVYAPKEVCRERAIKKGISLEDFERRIRFQMDIEEKKQKADYIVDNSNGLDYTKRQVLKLYNLLKKDP